MNLSTVCVPKARELPEGFVYLDEWIEDCIIDAKYAGTDNFMGRPAAGYEQPLVVASRQVAEGCVKAAEILRRQGYVLKVFDAFRPQRAVDDFCRWGEDGEDQRRKPIQYPDIEKLKMFDEGYIARKSTHTRGCSVGGQMPAMNAKRPNFRPKAAKKRKNVLHNPAPSDILSSIGCINFWIWKVRKIVNEFCNHANQLGTAAV